MTKEQIDKLSKLKTKYNRKSFIIGFLIGLGLIGSSLLTMLFSKMYLNNNLFFIFIMFFLNGIALSIIFMDHFKNMKKNIQKDLLEIFK